MSNLTDVPADIAHAFEVGNIPPGITVEFLMESRDGPTKAAIYFLFFFTFALMLARCYSRIFVVRKFGLDDWLACLTLIIYVPVLALAIVCIDNGSGRRSAYVHYVMSLDNDRSNQAELDDLVLHFLYTIALFTCRLSGLAFYTRLSAAHDHLFRTIKICAGIFVVVFIVQFFLLLFHCIPVTGKWPYSWQPDYHKYNCITWGGVYITMSALSFICDVIMFVIPSMLIHLLHVPLRRKLGLALVMFPGVLVLLITIARIYLVCLGQWSTDNTWLYDPQLAVEMAEIGSTLIALSIPALKPLFGVYVMTKIRSSSDDNRNDNMPYSNQLIRLS
ncbi:hypothetical protein BGW36DRAFT_19069 [Talaromyces proteolyticus]|uniref:Rhodopsin domain-containing protein n=1 Tax=Talaromyces proteolyticus TaxID=1131652 RepID=A0AAD4Q6Q3_9EURO|nr:uncharacterized protein BGW36DRAFT_19069 [Talaromyces proteolyticus]KAH8705883.1 hypothetical protein BGW36DRAFT_19069 [Talaromyces proteolyticus]